MLARRNPAAAISLGMFNFPQPNNQPPGLKCLSGWTLSHGPGRPTLHGSGHPGCSSVPKAQRQEPSKLADPGVPRGPGRGQAEERHLPGTCASLATSQSLCTAPLSLLQWPLFFSQSNPIIFPNRGFIMVHSRGQDQVPASGLQVRRSSYSES